MLGISLFSGCGGDTLGMTNAGINVHRYCEITTQFCETHKANFPNSKLIKNDITKISDDRWRKYNGRCDILFAGFPCQSHSNAGKKDPNDPRGQLYLNFVKATELIQPKYIIGENVKGLLSRKAPDGTLFIDKITQAFNDIGYNISYKVMNVSDYGVPQLRERLIILGNKENVLTFPPKLNQPVDLRNIVKFDMRGAIKITRQTYDMSTIPEECILTNDDNDEDEIEENIHPYLKSKIRIDEASYAGKTYTSLMSFSKRISPIHCEIIDIRKPSKTIICTYDHQPRLFVPLKNKNGYYLRCLLVDELKQIQGFPPDYQLTGNDKQKIIQIGNAVPPPLIEEVTKHILNL